jgi:sugar phosphate permease
MFVIIVLWTAFFVINFNVMLMIPLLPFIEQEAGLSASEAGLVLAAFPAVALLSNLALGPFIDRYGRKPFIVGGAAGCAAILLLTAAASGPIPIALCRAATGLFMPMVGASIFAAISDYVPAKDRSRVSGYVTSAAPIAFLVVDFSRCGARRADHVAALARHLCRNLSGTRGGRTPTASNRSQGAVVSADLKTDLSRSRVIALS